MKNKILKSITCAAALGFMVTSCMYEHLNDKLTPAFTVCAICAAWLLLFILANKKRIERSL